MTTLRWKEAYSVGDPHLDGQHKRLIELINMLEDESSTSVVLEALERYVEEHFRDEEKRMADGGYPDLEAHRQQHRAFEQWLAISGRAQRDGEVAAMLRDSMRSYLQSWLLNHIMVSDKAYSSYL